MKRRQAKGNFCARNRGQDVVSKITPARVGALVERKELGEGGSDLVIPLLAEGCVGEWQLCKRRGVLEANSSEHRELSQANGQSNATQRAPG